MKLRKIIIGGLVGIIGVPVLLAVSVIATVSVLDRTNGAIVSAGRKREYLLYVPRSYDRSKPTPLVISLHAAMNWPAFQRDVSHWNRLADEHGFIVVYPAGSGTGPKTWFMEGAETPARMPDVQFIAQLIDSLAAAYHIDPTRVYADGLSNGGGMAFALSCTLAGRIAAVGAVAAAQSLPFSWCPDSTPVPMIAFHGTADPVVPYEGGKVWIAPRPFPGIRSWTADWARRNHCATTPVDSTVAAEVIRTAYPGCAGGADVVLYTIQGGGHQWPGGKPMPAWIVGPASNSIDATRLIWAFFSAHPRRQPRPT